MAKRTSSGIPSPPKPPKLTLPKPSRRPSHPKPPSLRPAKLPAPLHVPKPARLTAIRSQPPKPPRLDFPKPRTSDELTSIPGTSRKLLLPSPKTIPIRAAAPPRPVPTPSPTPSPALAPVRTVLWISAYPALRQTTQLMLEGEGFEVHSASDFLQVESACSEDKFQLAIVDHTLAPKIKRAIAAVIRQKRPRTFILELCQISSEIPDADYVLIGHDPDALVRMVLRIAHERNKLGANHP